MTELYWITGPWAGRLAISARPRAGDWLKDEMSEWQRAGVDTVVSLLTIDEERELELEREAHVSRAAGMAFISFPIVDRDVPSSRLDLVRLTDQLNAELACGKNVVLHCRQGIGRAGLVAASLLMTAGAGLENAISEVSDARGLPVPETAEQRAWLAEFDTAAVHKSR